MAIINKLTAVADAIREKTGGTAKLTLDEMVDAIKSIQTGGSAVEGIVDSFEESTWKNGFIGDNGEYLEKDQTLGDMNMSDYIKIQPYTDGYTVTKVIFDANFNRVSYYDKNWRWLSNSYSYGGRTKYVQPGPINSAYYVLSGKTNGDKTKVAESQKTYKYTDENIFPEDATWTSGTFVTTPWGTGGYASQTGAHFSSPFNVADFAGTSIFVVQSAGVTVNETLKIAFWDGEGNHISGTYGRDILEYTIPTNAVTAKIAKPTDSTVLILANKTVIGVVSDLEE